MGSAVIGRERSCDCSLIGGEGLLRPSPPIREQSRDRSRPITALPIVTLYSLSILLSNLNYKVTHISFEFIHITCTLVNRPYFSVVMGNLSGISGMENLKLLHLL